LIKPRILEDFPPNGEGGGFWIGDLGTQILVKDSRLSQAATPVVVQHANNHRPFTATTGVAARAKHLG